MNPAATQASSQAVTPLASASMPEVARRLELTFSGNIPGLEGLFTDDYHNPARRKVEQGQEQVSVTQTLVSHGFQECSARVLINAHDGTVLLKHVGPKNCLEEGAGLVAQDPYFFFMQHAAVMSAPVCKIDIYGSLGYHSMHEPRKDEGMETEKLAELRIATGSRYKWKIAVQSEESRLVVQFRNSSGELEHHVYRWTEVRLPQPSDAQLTLLDTIERKRRVNYAILVLGDAPWASEELCSLREAAEILRSSRDLVAHLRYYEVDCAKSAWRRSFCEMLQRSAAGNAVDYERAISALDQILELAVVVSGTTNLTIGKISGVSEVLFTTLDEVRKKIDRNQAHLAGEALLAYFTTLVHSVTQPDELEGMDRAWYEQSIELLQSLAGDVRRLKATK